MQVLQPLGQLGMESGVIPDGTAEYLMQGGLLLVTPWFSHLPSGVQSQPLGVQGDLR